MKQDMKSICWRSSLLVFALFIICLSSIPVNANTTHKFVDISAGDSYYLALQDDGTVWTWGQMNCAQYTINTPNSTDVKYGLSWDQPVPVVVNICDVVAVSAGSMNSLALKNDGTVWSWGYNRFGNLGDGTTVSTPKGSLTPVHVVGLNNITAISAGGNACLALKNDGTVWSWGYNNNGDLGDGTYTIRLTPVQVKGLTNITMIGPGFAIKGDGTVYVWGNTLFTPDEAKNFTNSTIQGKNIPFPVPGVNNVSAMSSNGYDHTEFIKNGSVWGWGLDMNGELGDGKNINMNPPYLYVPVKAIGMDNITAISVGNNQYTLALTANGTVWAWGSNCGGALGDSKDFRYGNVIPNPTKISGLNNVTRIFAGGQNTIFLKNDGSVWVCGQNSNGQRGDGTIGGMINVPTCVLGPEGTNTNNEQIEPVSPSLLVPGNSSATTAGTNAVTVSVSAKPIQNSWIGIGIMVLAFFIFIGGCLIYLLLIRK